MWYLSPTISPATPIKLLASAVETLLGSCRVAAFFTRAVPILGDVVSRPAILFHEMIISVHQGVVLTRHSLVPLMIGSIQVRLLLILSSEVSHLHLKSLNLATIRSSLTLQSGMLIRRSIVTSHDVVVLLDLGFTLLFDHLKLSLQRELGLLKIVNLLFVCFTLDKTLICIAAKTLGFLSGVPDLVFEIFSLGEMEEV